MIDHSRRTMNGAIGKICTGILPKWGWTKENIRKECLDKIDDDWFGPPGMFLRYFDVTGRKPVK
jgi:hypothetical protein